MFIGHAALAFAAKAHRPRSPLALFLSATFGLDLLWPVLVLAGVEHVRIDPGNTAFTALAFDSYPWSHSLLMAIVWGLLAGVLVHLWRREARDAAMVGALVVSHWVLDWVTHRPDLPLAPWAGSPKVGLGLWNSIAGTLAVEGLMFGIGIGMYLRATRATGWVGKWVLAALLLFLVVTWAISPFAPPPPSDKAMALGGAVAGILFIPWTMWIDRHRPVRG